MELDHIKPNLVHEFFIIQSIGIIPLEQFKEVLPIEVYKKSRFKSCKTWHSLTSKAFFEYMYKVSHILNFFQNFSFLMFSIGSSLFFFGFIVRNFCRWGHHNQIVS
jgi:hypothetical protein